MTIISFRVGEWVVRRAESFTSGWRARLSPSSLSLSFRGEPESLCIIDASSPSILALREPTMQWVGDSPSATADELFCPKFLEIICRECTRSILHEAAPSSPPDVINRKCYLNISSHLFPIAEPGSAVQGDNWIFCSMNFHAFMITHSGE
jgi:hypothetical protein